MALGSGCAEHTTGASQTDVVIHGGRRCALTLFLHCVFLALSELADQLGSHPLCLHFSPGFFTDHGLSLAV